jgi:hypothetical protein
VPRGEDGDASAVDRANVCDTTVRCAIYPAERSTGADCGGWIGLQLRSAGVIRKLKGVSVLSEQLRSQTEKKVRTAAEALMREAEKGAAGLNRWMEDRTALISADSLARIRSSDNPLITLEHRQVPKQITTGLFCFAAASGVLSNSTEITRFTRAWMDHDRSVVQKMFRTVFDPAEAREISAWMDRVPGHAHRLHHGHDLAALMELRTQYGLNGILSWANHVMARDFWTPHGVPYLPAGSGSVYNWLVGTGVSPANAMSLLSINAAEAASGLLFVTAGRRLWRGASKFIANKRYSRELMNIKKLAGDNRHDEALKQLDRLQILADRNASPHLKLDLALFCLGMSLEPDFPSAVAWGHRAFRISEPLVNAAVDTPRAPTTRAELKSALPGSREPLR